MSQASTQEDGHLLPGERIDWETADRDVAPEATEKEIADKYVRGEVRIVVEQARYSLKQIPDLVQSADYNLQPDFQRRPRWSREKQSRLIESLIMNVPIPPIFLYEAEYSRYEVMDGRQRLTAISEFYANKFHLTGLTEWPELNGLDYQRLPEIVKRGVDRRYLSSIVLLHETAKSGEQADRLKQLVFERINSGGEDLSAHETRNALYPGPMNRLCIELARTPSFCRMWGIPEPTPDEDLNDPDWEPPPELAENPEFSHMEDVELVLRFFAHRQRKRLWRSGTRLEDYLTRYLRAANGFDSAVLDALARVFVETANLVYEVLGEEAFWLWRERGGVKQWVARPTLIAFDPVMHAFSLRLDSAGSLRANADRIRGELPDFYTEHYSAFDGRRTNLSDIQERDRVLLEYLDRFSSH